MTIILPCRSGPCPRTRGLRAWPGTIGAGIKVVHTHMLFLMRIGIMPPSSCPEKGEQIGIKLVFVRVGESVRATRVDFQSSILDEFGRGVSRGANRHDLVVAAVDD